MIKTMKRIVIFILCLPLFLLLLFIGYECVGAISNSIAAKHQTKEIITMIEQSDAQILDSDTFSGNTSGTGNHVDMCSLVIVKAKSIHDIENAIQDDSYVITPLDQLTDGLYDRFYQNMVIPEETENCYLISVCHSAPFSNNIVGH